MPFRMASPASARKLARSHCQPVATCLLGGADPSLADSAPGAHFLEGGDQILPGDKTPAASREEHSCQRTSWQHSACRVVPGRDPSSPHPPTLPSGSQDGHRAGRQVAHAPVQLVARSHAMCKRMAAAGPRPATGNCQGEEKHLATASLLNTPSTSARSRACATALSSRQAPPISVPPRLLVLPRRVNSESLDLAKVCHVALQRLASESGESTGSAPVPWHVHVDTA
jgi:hypothetical protein